MDAFWEALQQELRYFCLTSLHMRACATGVARSKRTQARIRCLLPKQTSFLLRISGVKKKNQCFESVSWVVSIGEHSISFHTAASYLRLLPVDSAALLRLTMEVATQLHLLTCHADVLFHEVALGRILVHANGIVFLDAGAAAADLNAVADGWVFV